MPRETEIDAVDGRVIAVYSNKTEYYFIVYWKDHQLFSVPQQKIGTPVVSLPPVPLHELYDISEEQQFASDGEFFAVIVDQAVVKFWSLFSGDFCGEIRAEGASLLTDVTLIPKGYLIANVVGNNACLLVYWIGEVSLSSSGGASVQQRVVLCMSSGDPALFAVSNGPSYLVCCVDPNQQVLMTCPYLGVLPVNWLAPLPLYADTTKHLAEHEAGNAYLRLVSQYIKTPNKSQINLGNYGAQATTDSVVADARIQFTKPRRCTKACKNPIVAVSRVSPGGHLVVMTSTGLLMHTTLPLDMFNRTVSDSILPSLEYTTICLAQQHGNALGFSADSSLYVFCTEKCMAVALTYASGATKKLTIVFVRPSGIKETGTDLKSLSSLVCPGYEKFSIVATGSEGALTVIEIFPK